MKEITDKLLVEFEKEVEKKLYADETLRFTWGKYEIVIPKKVIRSFEKKIKAYEAEGISDVSVNYSLLLKKRVIPFRVLGWGVKNLWSLLEDPEIEYFLYNFTRYTNRNYSRIPRSNFNFANLDNVYLENFDFITDLSCKSVEFNIRDIYGDVRRGAFLYEVYPKNSEYEERKKQLQMVLNADGSTPFDITFMALPEDYKPRKNSEIIHRKKLLYVLDIRRLKGEREIEEEIPAHSKTINPVLVFS